MHVPLLSDTVPFSPTVYTVTHPLVTTSRLLDNVVWLGIICNVVSVEEAINSHLSSGVSI